MAPNYSEQYLLPLNLTVDRTGLINLYEKLMDDPSARSSVRSLICKYRVFAPFLSTQMSHMFEDWCFFLETDGAEKSYFVIHKDGDAAGCIVVPLINCTRSTKTIFYEEHYPIRTVFKQSVQHLLNPESVEPTFESSITPEDSNAYLLRCGKWHSVYNGSGTSDSRIVLSWRSKPGFTWEEITAAFQSHGHMAALK